MADLNERIQDFLERNLPSAQEILDARVAAMVDLEFDDKLGLLRSQIAGNKDALKTMGDLEEAVTLMRKRYADQQLVRAGHILRIALTGDEYLQAVAQARREHPEAWTAVLPTKVVAETAVALIGAQKKKQQDDQTGDLLEESE